MFDSHLYHGRIRGALASCILVLAFSQLCLINIEEAQALMVLNTDGTNLDIIQASLQLQWN